jgi:hypothetical protein
MPTNSEDSEKASPHAEHPGVSSIPDEALHSPIVDTSVSSTNSDISNLAEITKPSDVSKDTAETSPSTDTFDSNKTSGRLQENEKTELSSDEGLKAFLTNENPVSINITFRDIIYRLCFYLKRRPVSPSSGKTYSIGPNQ